MNILDLKKNEYFIWMNILDFHKMNIVLNKYFGSSMPVPKMVVPKCLKLIWNHSGIISGTYFSPFQVVFYLYRGLRRAPKPYFGLILEFWIIFLIFLMNNSIKYLLISSRTVNCSEYEATLSYSFIVNSSESIAVQIIVQLLHWTSSVI